MDESKFDPVRHYNAKFNEVINEKRYTFDDFVNAFIATEDPHNYEDLYQEYLNGCFADGEEPYYDEFIDFKLMYKTKLIHRNWNKYIEEEAERIRIARENKEHYEYEEKIMLEMQNFGILPGGFPQGIPCSPFLSILVLNKFMSQTDHCIAYADDMIFFSNKPFTIRDFPSLGINLSRDKCG